MERREKARIEKLEAQILKSENALKKYNQHNRIVTISLKSTSWAKKISQVKQEIEDLYREYTE